MDWLVCGGIYRQDGMQVGILIYQNCLLTYNHHHMALQPKSGHGLPFWGFVTINFLRGWIVSPAPNLEDEASVFMTPGDRMAQIYPQALGKTYLHIKATEKFTVLKSVELYFSDHKKFSVVNII
jgi:hypothetical protein